MYGIIYGIENLINHKIYIGQTKHSLMKRVSRHKHDNQFAIGKAIQKYGWENFVVVILEECEDLDKLNEREIYWIKKLNSKAPNGYNLTDGGDGNPGHETSNATRDKISAIHKGKKLTEIHKARMAEGNRGQKRSDATRALISAIQRKSALNRHSIIGDAKISATKRKVAYPNLDAELIKQNLIYREIGRRLGIPKSTIQRKLSGVSRKIDEKTAHAIKDLLQVDMSIEELFKRASE